MKTSSCSARSLWLPSFCDELMISYYWFLYWLALPRQPLEKFEVRFCVAQDTAGHLFLLPSPCVPLSYKLPIPRGRNWYAWKGSFWHWICVQVSQVLAGPLLQQVGLAKIDSFSRVLIFWMVSPSRKRRAGKQKFTNRIQAARSLEAPQLQGIDNFDPPPSWLFSHMGCSKWLIADN